MGGRGRPRLLTAPDATMAFHATKRKSTENEGLPKKVSPLKKKNCLENTQGKKMQKETTQEDQKKQTEESDNTRSNNKESGTQNILKYDGVHVKGNDRDILR